VAVTTLVLFAPTGDGDPPVTVEGGRFPMALIDVGA
jgi:hypothetical protein